MTSTPPLHSVSPTPVDAKALAGVIIELNIARRNSLAYPKGHPVIASSLAKVLRVYEELLSNSGEITLGITNDSLLLNSEVLEKSNQVFRDFARVLFERGIGSLGFHRGLNLEELQRFTIILGLKREQIYQHGGIEQVWLKAQISSLVIQPIRYDLFLTTDDAGDTAEENHIGLWTLFARKLTMNDQNYSASETLELDPVILAEVLNHHHQDGSFGESEVSGAIATFMASAASESMTGEPYQKFAEFINNLTPELRRQFLASSFSNTRQTRQTRQSAAEQILTTLSDTVILETLEDISAQRLNVSSTVFGLLERLGKNVNAHQVMAESSLEDNELAEKMKIIMREHASEEFVPDDYQRKLNHIIATDQIPRLKIEEVSELMGTVDSRSIETSIGQILMNLVRDGVESPEERELLLQNLSDMFGFFLQTGDYGQLHRMIDQMNDDTFPLEIRYRLQDEYGRRDFLDEILNGLSVWGKPRYEDIRTLIHKIGASFVEPLLDRLSEESNMSLRRFFMDCLIDMGHITQVPITNRLYDTRWYFLRNLLIILTTQNIPSIVPYIQPLLRHSDPRLRHEALKALIHFRDPQAEIRILEDLDSPQHEIQSAALQLAERCTLPAIAVKLATMLTSGGYSQSECERKSVIIHTLGEMGKAEILPALAKFLTTRSLLHSRLLTKLKSEVIYTLPKYPPQVARPVLEHIASGSGELAKLATDALLTITGK
jgi:hypothetical protein